jgi:hypothetical protein
VAGAGRGRLRTLGGKRRQRIWDEAPAGRKRPWLRDLPIHFRMPSAEAPLALPPEKPADDPAQSVIEQTRPSRSS